MKERAKRFYPWYSRAHILANHIKNCSCNMCCNRRKFEGPTRQEKQKDDLDDTE